MRSPIAAGSANPSPPIAALREPSGSRAGSARCSSGRFDGRLLDHDRVAREPLGERREDVPGAQRLAGRRRRGRRGTRERPAVGRRARRRRRCELGADRRRRREHGEVGRAAMHLGRVLADHRQPRVPARRTGPARRGTGGTPARRRRARRRAARAARAAASGRPGGGRRRAGGPAGSRPGRRRTPARPGSRAARRARPAPPRSRRRRRRPRRRAPALRRVDRAPASSRDASPRSAASRAHHARGAASSCGSSASRGPVVHRHDHQRRPAPGRRLVIGAGDRARARPAARTGWSTQTG